MGKKTVKWYQCKRDIAVTVLVLLGFGIGVIGFNALYVLNDKAWTQHLSFIGEFFFRWGVWTITLATFIEAICICFEHYWKWISASVCGLLILNVIAVVVNSEGMGARLIESVNNIGFIATLIDVISECIPIIGSCALLSAPFVLSVLVVVFVIRKFNRKVV